MTKYYDWTNASSVSEFLSLSLSLRFKWARWNIYRYPNETESDEMNVAVIINVWFVCQDHCLFVSFWALLIKWRIYTNHMQSSEYIWSCANLLSFDEMKLLPLSMFSVHRIGLDQILPQNIAKFRFIRNI